MLKTTTLSTVGPKLDGMGDLEEASIVAMAETMAGIDWDFMQLRIVVEELLVEFGEPHPRAEDRLSQLPAATSAVIEPRPGAGPKTEPLSSM